MTALVAWRILTHELGRTTLAVGGILIAILLIFLQLGFYASVPRGGMLFYDAMQFDVMLTSSAYVFQGQSWTFPRRRLYQALAVPGVARAVAVYQNSGRWVNDKAGIARDVFVLGFNPQESVFEQADIQHQVQILFRPDTILVDKATRAEFGSLEAGRVVEIEQRAVRIGGLYSLGTGFLDLGAVVTSDLNFIRLFPKRTLDDVSLGLLTLLPAVDANQVVAHLRQIMAADTQVFTRQELAATEAGHWLTGTSAGLVFGLGVLVAFVVGLVILNQTLSAQITRHLPQYATLKAIGHTDGSLACIVISLATILSIIGYVPAMILATMIYAVMRRATMLPIEMTADRVVAVFAIALTMSMGSALVSLRMLRRADPAELF